MDLQHPTNVAGTQLKSGSYTVEWQGTGDQVQLKIYRGKKNIVSTSARMVSIESPAPYDSSLVTDNGDGTRTLSQIRFGGKKFAIEVTNEGGSAGGAGASK
jgi:hypothetical protein